MLVLRMISPPAPADLSPWLTDRLSGISLWQYHRVDRGLPGGPGVPLQPLLRLVRVSGGGHHIG